MKLTTILSLVMLACVAFAADPATLTLTRTIPLPGVKGRFDHFAIDVKARRLFVAALGNNTLEIIDLAAGKRLRSLPSMSKPTGVLYPQDSHQILVANGDDGTLKILDAGTFNVVKSLGGLEDADNLRFDPKTRLAYLGFADGCLGIIDTLALKEVGRVPLPKHPESFQLEQNGSRIFVNVPGAKQVAVIDREKKSVIQTWPMEKFQANFPMALDEPHHRLFAGCRKPARLVVLDTAAGKPVADLPISGDTDDLFYDANRQRLYLACGEGFVNVIDQRGADSYQLRERIPTRAGARTACFSKDLNEFYLAVPQHGNEPAELRIFQPQN